MRQNRRINSSIKNVGKRVRFWFMFHELSVTEKSILVQIR